GALGRVDVKTDYVAYFLDEKRIARELECLRTMRLQCERTPDALYARDRNAYRARHATRTPVCSSHKRAFERLHDYGLDPLVRNRARCAGPRLVVQAIQALLNKAPVPLADGCRIYPQSHRSILGPSTRAGRQHNAGSPERSFAAAKASPVQPVLPRS